MHQEFDDPNDPPTEITEAPEESTPATEIVKAVKKAKKRKPAKAKAKAKKGPVKAKPKERKPTKIQAAKAAKRAKRLADRAKGKKLRGPGGEPVERRGDPKVAKRVKSKRLALGLTQKQLAAKVGCGQPTVALWEGAISGVGHKYAKKLGKILGMTFAKGE